MQHAYTPCPVCSPARACFFTGRLPSQHGIHDWIREAGDSRRWMAKERTLATLLQEAGYHTGLAGKWHCGQGEIAGAGFDYYLTHQTDQYPHRGEPHFMEQGKPISFRGQQTALVTSRALQFLRSRDRAAPFFLFVGYVDTHSPFKDHPERLVRRYRKAKFTDIPHESYHGPGRALHLPPTDKATQREYLAQYYAAVTYIDEQIGILLDELEGTGDLDNTLIVYTSDHGHNNGHHGLYTKGNATVPQNFLEESIHVPCLLRWPGRIQEGRRHSFPVDHCDLFQTLLDAAGCQEEESRARLRNSPGRSYLPLLTGKAPHPFGKDEANHIHPSSFILHPLEDWRSEQFCEYGNARMIRTERYKLIVRYPPHSEKFSNELYDLQEDPRETRNRIALPHLAETALLLRAHLDAYFARYEEPESSGREILKRPVHNPNEPWRTALS